MILLGAFGVGIGVAGLASGVAALPVLGGGGGGASHLVDYISVHIRFDLERYLLNNRFHLTTD